MFRQICILALVACALSQPLPSEQEERPAPYSMSYDVQRDSEGVVSWRREEGDENGNKRGSYGYRGADGVYREVQYIADENGYRAWIKSNEPGMANASPSDVEMTAEKTPDAVVHRIEQEQRQRAAAMLRL